MSVGDGEFRGGNVRGQVSANAPAYKCAATPPVILLRDHGHGARRSSRGSKKSTLASRTSAHHENDKIFIH